MLAVGGVYFAMVAVTNAVNFIASVTKVYSWPAWTANAAVLMAALAEGFGACLFGRALLRFRGRTAGIQAVWLALGWNIAVWLGLIVGTDFFVAYKSEVPSNAQGKMPEKATTIARSLLVSSLPEHD